MIWYRPIRDRRGRYRPSNGDRKVCPCCAHHSLEFSDRYRLAGPDGVVASTPAWACDQPGCGYGEPVRGESAARHEQRVSRSIARAALRLPYRGKKGG